jgi:long-chain acyl-CoA synthetase
VAQTVPGLLAVRAAAEPDHVAIETYGVGSLTLREWWRRSTALAAGLLDRGVSRGARVVLHFGVPDWIDFAVAYCGVQLAGGVPVPCADRLATAEVRYIVEHCAASGVLHAAGAPVPPPERGWSATLAEVTGPHGGLPTGGLPTGGLPTGGLPAGAGLADVPVRPGDPAQLIYTSGTTGRPKAVQASHANLTFGAATHPNRRRLGHSRHFLHAFPIGTNAGQTMLINALDARPTALTLPRATPMRFAQLAERYAVGSVFVVPALAIELLGSGALDRHDLSAVVLFGSTAAALPPAVAAALAGRLPGATIVNYYTSTEAAPAQLAMVFDPARPDSVGRAAGGELAVRDEAGHPVPAGQPGEVWLRAPFPRSYYRDEAASRATFQGGWVRMGDLGRLDPDGYLYLVDRDQDVIKSGADKVSTLQVEAALYEHPAVAEAAVVGVPHPVLGMAVAAAVVPRAGLGPDSRAELATDRLRGFLVDRLARHELPAQVILVDRLPRNPAGKVLKRELRERFGEGLNERFSA